MTGRICGKSRFKPGVKEQGRDNESGELVEGEQ